MTCEAAILAHLKVFRLTTREISVATGFSFDYVKQVLWKLRKAGRIRRLNSQRWEIVR
jgi:hypothetical protein